MHILYVPYTYPSIALPSLSQLEPELSLTEYVLDNEWDNCRLDVCKQFATVFCCQQLGMVLMVFELPIRASHKAHISSWTDVNYPYKRTRMGASAAHTTSFKTPTWRGVRPFPIPLAYNSLTQLLVNHIDTQKPTILAFPLWPDQVPISSDTSLESRDIWRDTSLYKHVKESRLLGIFLKEPIVINLQYCSSGALNLFRSLILYYKVVSVHIWWAMCIFVLCERGKRGEKYVGLSPRVSIYKLRQPCGTRESPIEVSIFWKWSLGGFTFVCCVQDKTMDFFLGRQLIVPNMRPEHARKS